MLRKHFFLVFFKDCIPISACYPGTIHICEWALNSQYNCSFKLNMHVHHVQSILICYSKKKYCCPLISIH